MAIDQLPDVMSWQLMSFGTHAPPEPVPMSAPRLLSRFFVVFYWFLSQGVVDWSQRQGPGEEILGSTLQEKETRDRGPVMQIHQLFIYHLPLSPFIGTHSQLISLSEAGCVQLRSLEKAAQASHVWSSELGVTTEFPSSCNNFTGPADTDKQSQPAHNWTHENSDNTSPSPDRQGVLWNVVRLSRHWHHHLETELDTRRFSVKLDPRDVLNGRETDERV